MGSSPQHYLALRPCIELLTIGGNREEALLIPSRAISASNLALFRLGQEQSAQSRTSSFFLLLTSGGLIVYLLYKGLSEEQEEEQRSSWSWLKWLIFGDTRSLQNSYFGPSNPQPQQPSVNLMPSSALPKHVKSPKKANIVYVSPCPNCVRGVCKIRKHQHHQLLYQRHQCIPILAEKSSASTSGSSTPNAKISHLTPTKNSKLPPTKTAESADDESSDEEEYKKVKKVRIPPEGREKVKFVSSMTRDDYSMDSIGGEVSGSMVDLVKGAREVRRLIRETSFDSLASEFSLDLRDNLGSGTASYFEGISSEVSRLKDNCDSMSENIDLNSYSKAKMKSSKSEYFSKELSPPHQNQSTVDSLSSSPDLRNLHKMIHSAKNKTLWTLTTAVSDTESSPMHYRDSSASPMLHDPRDQRYKVVLSSNTSECGDWEWDSEGMSFNDLGPNGNPEGFTLENHENWLQDDVLELDLEAELLTSTFNQRLNSDSDTEFSSKVRLPPSGRSSVTSHHDSYSRPLMSLQFSRSSSSGSLKSLESPFDPISSLKQRNSRSKRSPSSDESGIEDKSENYNSSMKSSISTSGVFSTPLSPVHEARESPKRSPDKRPLRPRRILNEMNN